MLGGETQALVVFVDPARYIRGRAGVEPARALTAKDVDEEHERMARLGGFEPPALCLEGRCSIQLSYRRVGQHYLPGG